MKHTYLSLCQNHTPDDLNTLHHLISQLNSNAQTANPAWKPSLSPYFFIQKDGTLYDGSFRCMTPPTPEADRSAALSASSGYLYHLNDKTLTEYRILPNYPDYLIGSNGHLYSAKTRILREMSCAAEGLISLYTKNGPTIKKQPRTLVYEAFSETTVPKGSIVCTLNNDPTDNRFDNLYLTTCAEYQKKINQQSFDENSHNIPVILEYNHQTIVFPNKKEACMHQQISLPTLNRMLDDPNSGWNYAPKKQTDNQWDPSDALQPHPEYPHYMASASGHIVSTKKEPWIYLSETATNRINDPTVSVMHQSGSFKNITVKKFVAEAFGILPLNADRKTILLHKDKNPANNKPDNLYCSTISKQRMNLPPEQRNTRPEKPIAQYDLHSGELIRTFASAKEAKKILQIATPHIGAVCSGSRKSAGGFIWRYLEKDGSCPSHVQGFPEQSKQPKKASISVLITDSETGAIHTAPTINKAAEFLHCSTKTVRAHLDQDKPFNQYYLQTFQ